MTPHYETPEVTLWHGDCLDVLRTLPDCSVDAVVTDPPYGLEFMGKGWDAPWRESDVNADAGFNGGGIDATKRLPSFTGSTNPKCFRCKGTRRGRRDGTAKVSVCLCDDGGRFPNVRAVEMRAFGEWCLEWTAECLRVLKPGGHLLAFGGTRTWHRLAVAIEDAGFEIRDSIAWMYGSGFPKSLDVSKAIDKASGAEREILGRRVGAGNGSVVGLGSGRSMASEYDATAPATDAARTWQGWGTALKPAFEPIVVARKPLTGTVAGNVLAHGTGALNIDGCRIAGEKVRTTRTTALGVMNDDGWQPRPGVFESHDAGRWPANVVLDETQAAALDQQSGESVSLGGSRGGTRGMFFGMAAQPDVKPGFGDTGGASRFFYVAKADASERPKVAGVAHPTVKPLALMRWLVRLVTPPGGVVLEPFAGSGTTVEACLLEGFHCVAIEKGDEYLPLIEARIHRRRDPVAAARLAATGDDEASLFDLLNEEGA